MWTANKLTRTKLLSFFVVIGMTASCGQNAGKLAPFAGLSEKEVIASEPTTDVQKENSFSLTALNDLVEQPDVKSASAAVEAAQQSIARIEANSAPTMSVSADSGFVVDSNDVQPRLNPVFTIAQSVDDGGLQRAELQIAQLNLKVAQNELYDLIDEKIAIVLEARILNDYVDEIDSLLTSFENYYAEKDQDISQAVAFGAVSQGEFLELQQSLLTLKERRLNLEDLKTKIALLKSSSSSKQLPQTSQISVLQMVDERLKAEDIISIQNAKIREEIAGYKILAAKSAGELQVSSLARLSGTQDTSSDVQAFAGLQITFPVFDGGRLNADVKKLREEAKSLSSITESVIKSLREQYKAYSESQHILKRKLELNEMQIGVATKRVKLQKDLLTSGQVKLSEIVSSVINELQLKIQYSDLELQARMAELEMLKEVSAACELINSCDELVHFSSMGKHG